MPRALSHVPDTKIRKYPGEERTASFIEWLNFEKDQEARTRVIELAKLLNELKMVAYSLPETVAASSSAWERHPKVKRLEALEKEIDQRLSRYRGVRKVMAGVGGYFSVYWHDLDYVARRGGWRQMPALSEFGAINGLMDSIQSGAFWRIRQCGCGSFFFCRFKHQSSCSERCRVKKYRSSPDWIQHRNEKAREYYWLHKNTNVK